MEIRFATSKATAAFRDRFAAVTGNREKLSPDNFRQSNSLSLSSIGIGTYLGNWDSDTDKKYTEAIVEYLRLGGNVIDTAPNYRFQRSERCIGEALRETKAELTRDSIFVCSKGGYLPFDSEPPSDVANYFEENFVKTGVAKFEDLVGGSHCMTPGYLTSQIEQSLRNMKIDGLDLFYIHNPESQLAEVDRYTFEARIAKAFEALETARSEAKINFYGVATWNGFRIAPDESVYHSLERFANIARQVGGEANGFKFVQLPYNLAMPEAFLVPNQAVKGKALPTIQAAEDLGISVMISAPLLQGQLAMNVPLNIRQALGALTTDAMTSLQFVRSTPGVTTALVGMSSREHVVENMALARKRIASPDVFGDLFSGRQSA
ncbi:MAG: aldo/keto reductase [Acidobacteriota bacterium]|nr:aldo/keto reductase [Acidobacteriota bacterium]MDH3528326.1 aldo/keto reductase [Acidobacteriota bacterium]